MKMPLRILLIAVSLTGFALALCVFALFSPTPVLTYEINRYRDIFPWLNTVFAALLVFVCLCFFVLLLISVLFPSKSGEVVFNKGRGELRYSRQAVESTARYSFADVQGISYCSVRARVRGKPEKTTVRVKLAFTGPDRLAELTESVQLRIEEALMSSLGITAKAINIDVRGVVGNESVQESESEGGRVV